MVKLYLFNKCIFVCNWGILNFFVFFFRIFVVIENIENGKIILVIIWKLEGKFVLIFGVFVIIVIKIEDIFLVEMIVDYY